jgi:periplasmic protein TonB
MMGVRISPDVSFRNKKDLNFIKGFFVILCLFIIKSAAISTETEYKCTDKSNLTSAFDVSPLFCESEEPEPVLLRIENLPEFPGGDVALFKFMSDNIKYPAFAVKNQIQGQVICQFIVNRDGSIVDVKVIHSVHPVLDKEAVRVIKSMPVWLPGRKRGVAVRAKYTLPVNFKLN